MPSPIETLKSKLSKGENKASITTAFYFLAKELGCLGDLLGREYVMDYHGEKISIVQKPIPLSSFLVLLKEMEQEVKMQDKQMKKAKRGR